jgi:hypothetical protein
MSNFPTLADLQCSSPPFGSFSFDVGAELPNISNRRDKVFTGDINSRGHLLASILIQIIRAIVIARCALWHERLLAGFNFLARSFEWFRCGVIEALKESKLTF